MLQCNSGYDERQDWKMQLIHPPPKKKMSSHYPLAGALLILYGILGGYVKSHHGEGQYGLLEIIKRWKTSILCGSLVSWSKILFPSWHTHYLFLLFYRPWNQTSKFCTEKGWNRTPIWSFPGFILSIGGRMHELIGDPEWRVFVPQENFNMLLWRCDPKVFPCWMFFDRYK